MPEKTIKIATLSKWLGIAGLVSVPAALVFGFIVEQIGIVSILRSVSVPLCMAAAAIGLIVTNRVGESNEVAKKNGRLGLLLGLAGLGIAVLIMVLVMLFFLPLLFLSR